MSVFLGVYLFGESPLYATLGKYYIFNDITNWQMMILNGIYLFAAFGSMLITLVIVANRDIGQVLIRSGRVPGLDERVSKMMIGGISVSVGFYVSGLYTTVK